MSSPVLLNEFRVALSQLMSDEHGNDGLLIAKAKEIVECYDQKTPNSELKDIIYQNLDKLSKLAAFVIEFDDSKFSGNKLNSRIRAILKFCKSLNSYEFENLDDMDISSFDTLQSITIILEVNNYKFHGNFMK